MTKENFITENDIRPKDIMVGQKKAMHKDIAWLKKRSPSFVKVNCPACDKDVGEVIYEKYYLKHVVCRSCSTQYVNPRPTEEILKNFYKNSVNYTYWAKYIFSASKEVRKERIFKPRAEYLSKILKQKSISGKLLEVGAAYGFFCEAVIELKLFDKVIAIEQTPDLAKMLRSMGVEVIESSYEDVILDDLVDVIVNFEVIEHLFSPKDFLNWCYKNLKPGGCIYLTCPNIGGFETIVLGSESGTVDHEHLNLFNTESIKTLVEKIGFNDVIVETPGQLDFDIVKKNYIEGKIKKSAIGVYLSQLLEKDDQKKAQLFQDYLIKSNSSSHMMLLAFKPKA